VDNGAAETIIASVAGLKTTTICATFKHVCRGLRGLSNPFSTHTLLYQLAQKEKWKIYIIKSLARKYAIQNKRERYVWRPRLTDTRYSGRGSTKEMEICMQQIARSILHLLITFYLMVRYEPFLACRCKLIFRTKSH